MLSNKVAPILVCWFKSVSGYADTVSAACKPQPAHMFWMRASVWIWLLWLLFGKYLPACRAGLRSLAKGERKRERGTRWEDERLEYLVFNHNTRTLDLGNVMIYFCVWSKTSSTEIRQILRDPTGAWGNAMVSSLACEQISDSFCLATN